ncbi:MAG: AraC family transcriptional regulator ligand-binding domain-containing protein [Acidobacteriota bacterium]
MSMRHANTFAVHPGWRLLLKDAGIDATRVLRRSGLPDDLFARPSASLSPRDYFRFWRALEAEAADPTLPIRIGAAISVEAFDAPIFAALCSQNLSTALGRLRRYKPLIGPMSLRIDQDPVATRLQIEYLDESETPPGVLAATELVFFVQLARLGLVEVLDLEPCCDRILVD